MTQSYASLSCNMVMPCLTWQKNIPVSWQTGSYCKLTSLMTDCPVRGHALLDMTEQSNTLSHDRQVVTASRPVSWQTGLVSRSRLGCQDALKIAEVTSCRSNALWFVLPFERNRLVREKVHWSRHRSCNSSLLVSRADCSVAGGGARCLSRWTSIPG